MTAPSAATAYLTGLGALLDRLRTEQDRQVERASELMAESIRGGGLVHIFGSGHSMLPALEIFPRYGSFVGLHPIVDPRLLWFNVLGSFGVPEMALPPEHRLCGRARGEAFVDVHGLAEPVGAMTTVLAMAAGLAVVARTAQRLAESGYELVQSVRAEADETVEYRNVYDAYERSLARTSPPG